MCAQFDLKILANILSLKYGVAVHEDFEFNHRVTPHSLAPVITNKGLEMMKFSLLPSWSKEAKVKFATHNARIESIDEKATWRGPFKKNHGLIPMLKFIEPIYTNEFAGNMVAFAENHEELLTAAGVFDSWVNKETGEIINSFAIITTAPPKFIHDIGHDRCPLFLKDTAFKDWLNNSETDSKKLKSFLLDNEAKLEFSATKDRPMKPGWEKRK
jgi:putative SOS response-associated peptidase YedK